MQYHQCLGPACIMKAKTKTKGQTLTVFVTKPFACRTPSWWGVTALRLSNTILGGVTALRLSNTIRGG